MNSTISLDSINCTLNPADSVWVGFSSILTMIMSPAVGFVYAGLVSPGAIGSMLGFCFSIFSLITILWVIIGYSLVYGNSLGGFIGDMTYAGLAHLTDFKSKCIGQFGINKCVEYHHYWESCGIPEILVMFFQAKFAAITPVLLLGSISERMILHYNLIFLTIWTLCIYCPIAHWVWNESGFLAGLGVKDFAGGLVVHQTSGYGALVTSIFLGKRKTYGKCPEVSNFPTVILGTTLLWFGWFGFNGGSSFSMNKIGVIAIVNTNISASAALLIWIIIDYLVYKRITALGLAMGVISGLIAITPCAGYVDPRFSILIGAVAAGLCWIGISVRKRFHLYDDLDVFTCHGICGTWGTICVGLFASKEINPLIANNGLFLALGIPDENKYLIVYQIIACFVVIFYTLFVTYFILLVMKFFCKFTATKDEEVQYDHINFFDEFRNKKINVEVIR